MLLHAEFDVSERPDRHIVLRASGEIDLSAKTLFEERFADVSEAHDGDVVVDLAGVTFFDVAGLGALLQARQRLDAAGRKLLIARPSRRVSRVLEVTRVEALFENRG